MLQPLPQEQTIMAETDRISQLPADILDNILGFLPIEDAAKTVVLSTNWGGIWPNLTQLCFAPHFFRRLKNRYSTKHAAFYVITKILLQHKGPTIRKFEVDYYDSKTETVKSRSYDIDQWLLLVTRKGVEEIKLHLVSQEYELPDCVLSCPTLKSLDLDSLLVRPLRSTYMLPNVASLRFGSINFDVFSDLVLDVPSLENLSFEECYEMFHLHIIAKSICSLNIRYCSSRESDSFIPVNMDLRSIRTLHLDSHSLQNFVDDCSRTGLPLRSPALNVEDLNLSGFCFKKETQASPLIRLLHICPNLIKLHISLWCPVTWRCDSTYDDEKDIPSVAEVDRRLPELRSVAQRRKRLVTLKLILFKGFWCEMLFIKELLAALPSLQEVIIGHSNDMDSKRKCEVMERVLHFPRASTEANVTCI
ncbi:unnamed protein product [Cuscuta europaea]|uniref:F-box domain-containing protein n=1 Tax=Cuscuta europaea TaxID=41803 RepID=A0A9P1EPZ0_CUSEU|nr:unnamed protein product [Cuscuta europaea]